MILDAQNSIYVWIGAGANPEEKEEAENTAKVLHLKHRLLIAVICHITSSLYFFQKYLEQGALPRPEGTTIELVYQGEETPAFKNFFRQWDDNLFHSVSQLQLHKISLRLKASSRQIFDIPVLAFAHLLDELIQLYRFCPEHQNWQFLKVMVWMRCPVKMEEVLWSVNYVQH